LRTKNGQKKIIIIIIITRAKLVAKQRVGLPLMSEVKLEVPVRSRALKPTTRVTKIKR